MPCTELLVAYTTLTGDNKDGHLMPAVMLIGLGFEIYWFGVVHFDTA